MDSWPAGTNRKCRWAGPISGSPIVFFRPGTAGRLRKGRESSLAGDHGPGRFYYGFDLLPWKGGCLVAYSRGAIGLSPEIYLAWCEDPDTGFSELMRISAPKEDFEHLYPRLVRSGENEVAVVYNRREGPPVSIGTAGHIGGLVGGPDRNSVVGGKVWKTFENVEKSSHGLGLSPGACRVRGVVLFWASDSVRVAP